MGILILKRCLEMLSALYLLLILQIPVISIAFFELLLDGYAAQETRDLCGRNAYASNGEPEWNLFDALRENRANSSHCTTLVRSRFNDEVRF